MGCSDLNPDSGRQTQEAPRIIAGNQIAVRAFAHCHDDQPECAALLQKR
jgi:hypothetical protein